MIVSEIIYSEFFYHFQRFIVTRHRYIAKGLIKDLEKNSIRKYI